jgi:hypothetical protein
MGCTKLKQLVLDCENVENVIRKKCRRANYQFKPKKIQVVPEEGGKIVELAKAEKEYYVTGTTISFLLNEFTQRLQYQIE